MLIAAIIVFCGVLFVLAFLFPRMSGPVERGGDAPLRVGQRAAGEAPGASAAGSRSLSARPGRPCTRAARPVARAVSSSPSRRIQGASRGARADVPATPFPVKRAASHADAARNRCDSRRGRKPAAPGARPRPLLGASPVWWLNAALVAAAAATLLHARPRGSRRSRARTLDVVDAGTRVLRRGALRRPPALPPQRPLVLARRPAARVRPDLRRRRSTS